MNGLLDLRAQGSDMAAVAARMRLGHIPAGSTDAVAYSINGTRSQLTAALHIALGDRSTLLLIIPSVLSIVTAKHAHSTCRLPEEDA